MPVIQSSPLNGYQDYQRTENYDSPILFQQINATIGAGITSPVLNTQRYAFIGGIDGCGSGKSLATITWYEDPSPTNSVGSIVIPTDASVALQAQLRIPNLGPYCQFVWTDIAGGGSRQNSRLIGSNKSYFGPFVPTSPWLIDQPSAAISVSATVTLYPNSFFAGPVQIFAQTSLTSWQLQTQFMNVTGGYDDGPTWLFSAAATPEVVQFIAPLTAWRVNVINGTAGAGTYFLSAIPSLTGAS